MTRFLGATTVTITLEGAPGTTVELPASGLRGTDPVGLVTRLEHRLAELETRKAKALADIEYARRQITHARSSIGQPFPHATALTAARDRVREIDAQLDRMAHQDPGESGTPEQEIAGTGNQAEPGPGRTRARSRRTTPRAHHQRALNLRAARTLPCRGNVPPRPQRPGAG